MLGPVGEPLNLLDTDFTSYCIIFAPLLALPTGQRDCNKVKNVLPPFFVQKQKNKTVLIGTVKELCDRKYVIGTLIEER